MTSEMIMLRPMRRTDFPALEELVRQAWYVDDESDDNGNVPNDERGLRKYKLRKAIHYIAVRQGDNSVPPGLRQWYCFFRCRFKQVSGNITP